jgi:hypothetical protein
MSAYHEGFMKGTSDNGSTVVVPDWFAREWPALAEALRGLEGNGKGGGAVGPATITFWCEGLEIRFSVKPRGNGVVGFGVLRPSENLGRCFDEEMAEGRIGWKADKKKSF